MSFSLQLPPKSPGFILNVDNIFIVFRQELETLLFRAGEGFIVFLTFSLLFLIWLFGFQFLRKVIKINSLPFLIPAGLVVSFSLVIVFFNLLSFIFPVKVAAWILLAIILIANFKLKKIEAPSLEKVGLKEVFFLILTVFIWGLLIFWKANFVLWGSDRNLYYSISSTFLEGNFPIHAPWQPDELLSYHFGVSLLLAFFSYFTKVSFDFIHLLVASLIIMAIPLFISAFLKVKDLYSFLFSTLISLVAIISFGFIKIPILQLPPKIPLINSPNSLIIWLRELPTAVNSIDSLGAPIDLDSALYVLFHPFGLSLILTFIGLLKLEAANKQSLKFAQGLNYKFKTQILIALLLISLGLINEIFFFPLFIIFALHLKKNFTSLALISVTLLAVLFQGGIISHFSDKDHPQSLIILPSSDFEEGRFRNYQLAQAKTKVLPQVTQTDTFQWISIGVDLLLVLILVLLILKGDFKKDSFYLNLYLVGVFFFLFYFSILPIFESSNSNRIIIVSFWSLSLLLLLLIYQWAVSKTYRSICLIILGLFLLPTILPPLAKLSQTRFGESRFQIKANSVDEISEAVKKIVKTDRVAVLDKNSPHPSGAAEIMIKAGVFSPVFSKGFRTYTIEPGPEYTDIVYTLSPKAIKDLSVKYLLIDNSYYQTLPEVRQKLLDNPDFFKELYKLEKGEGWQKIYLIEDKYTEEAELEGSILELNQLVPKDARVYIDEDKNITPDFLRRPIIFLLRDRTLYYIWGSGVYLHVQEPVSGNRPEEGIKYDYLILSPTINPENICHCQTELVWRLVNNKLLLWKTVYP